VKVVLDSSILVRSFSKPDGLANQLLLRLFKDKHKLILSNELLSEVAKVLRYPRLMAMHERNEEAIYDFASSISPLRCERTLSS
jgi:predicted nucleic acid-binding protein